MPTTPSPRTHSKILWHFTGGPIWDNVRNVQTRRAKPVESAYKTLLAILKSKKLKLGGYHELIKVKVPVEPYYDVDTKSIKTRRNQVKEVRTSQVCCVADIPLSELHFHAKRYGRIAIGFHRKALITANFNPVLYTRLDSDIVKNFYDAQRSLGLMDASSIEDEISNFKDEIESEVSDVLDDFSLNADGSNISLEADMLVSEATTALERLEDSLAFVKTYKSSDFETIYAEREWRSTEEFEFDPKDIAMILLQSSGTVDYFKKFVDEDIENLEIPRSVSIVRWEDVVA